MLLEEAHNAFHNVTYYSQEGIRKEYGLDVSSRTRIKK
jgi:hypothetical protein